VEATLYLSALQSPTHHPCYNIDNDAKDPICVHGRPLLQFSAFFLSIVGKRLFGDGEILQQLQD